MARLNVKTPITTHEGAPAVRISPEQQLRRSVMSCMLWENEFYEDGVSIADRITSLVTSSNISLAKVADMAVEARTVGNLRHVPLLLLNALARTGYAGTADTVERVIQRPDEITELVAVYWKDGKRPLPASFKRGLARAFGKFKEHTLAKYDRDNSDIKLRDVMRMVHPRPRDAEQAALFKRVVSRTLATPDTWEVALSGGADKRETFERLLREGNLGYLALLRNLRNMDQSGVDTGLVNDAIRARKNGAERVLPFRFVAAARAAPRFERALDDSLLATIQAMPELLGSTTVLVDVSGSMDQRLSAKSDMTRMDAACALASLIDGDVDVYSFSSRIVPVPHRLGMAGVDAIRGSQGHGGTDLGGALHYLSERGRRDRLIVITDEQSYTRAVAPQNYRRCYLINVASYENGVGYGDWVHIDGFSEAVIKFIHAVEGGPA